MNDVVQFPGTGPVEAVPVPVNEKLVVMLEGLLERVKTGELQSFVCLGFCADGQIVKGTSLRVGDNYYKLRGALDWLKEDVCRVTEDNSSLEG